MARGVTMDFTVGIKLTPRVIAEAFAAMTSHEQTEFFVTLDSIMASWPNAGREMQLRYLADSIRDSGDDGARDMLRTLAEMLAERAEREALALRERMEGGQ